jgi:membrane associated rhomboid family serine protease
VGLYAGWRKTRFFGTTAPLIVFLVFSLLAVTVAHQNVLTFLWIALPFLIVFMAGVCADLLEIRSRWSGLITGMLLATLASHALFSIVGLWRI